MLGTFLLIEGWLSAIVCGNVSHWLEQKGVGHFPNEVVARSIGFRGALSPDALHNCSEKSFKKIYHTIQQEWESYLLESDTQYRDAEYRGIIAVRGSEIALCGSEPLFWILI